MVRPEDLSPAPPPRRGEGDQNDRRRGSRGRSQELTVDAVQTALKDVLDPEYPISIVDLGLIRGVEVEGSKVTVRLTYTSLGCPCTELIRDDIEARLRQLPGVASVEIREVFERWSRANISKEGLIQLRRVGVV